MKKIKKAVALLMVMVLCLGMFAAIPVTALDEAVPNDYELFAITPTAKVAANTDNSFVIKDDGSLWGWGNNNSGQIGDGTKIMRLAAFKIMDDAVSVSTSGNHTLAVKSDGSLWAWGDNSSGKLGDGTTTERLSPVKIMNNVISAAAGGTRSLAVTSDGKLWSWGYSSYGLGDGITTESMTPIEVMDDVVYIIAGQAHNLAVRTDGSLWAWGYNFYGQLGDGTTTNSSIPVKVLDDVVRVTASYNSSMAIVDGGSLFAWGASDWDGLGLGVGNNLVYIKQPTLVTDEVSDMALGHMFSLIVKEDGTLLACGYNSAGQLGDGTKTNRNKLIEVFDDVVYAACGLTHSLVVRSDGSLWGWGNDAGGQMGDGTGSDYVFPIPALCDLPDTVKLAAGDAHGMALKNDGCLWIWGDSTNGQQGDGTTVDRPNPWMIMEDVIDMAGGSHHTLALKADGTVWAWGNNGYGQVGNGSNNYNWLTPVKVLEDVIKVACGENTSFGIKSDNSLWAWGSNTYGALGIDTNNSDIKIPAKIMEDVADVAGGHDFTVVLKTDGSVWTFGNNNAGQLGDGTKDRRTEPLMIIDGGVVAIAANATGAQAIKSDGSLWTWGDNSRGQVGNGSISDQLTPLKVINEGVSSVVSAGLRVMVIKDDGSLWAWGSGPLGDRGSDASNRLNPVEIIESDVEMVAGRLHTTYALKSDGSVWIWGGNLRGSQGYDPTVPRMLMGEGSILHYIPTLSAPTANIPSGNFYEPFDIELSAAEGASVYYTDDGSNPTISTGILYNGPFTITDTTVIKAIAIKEGMNNSKIAVFTYNLVIPDITSISINPPNAILTNDTDIVTFTVDIRSEYVNTSKIEWQNEDLKISIAPAGDNLSAVVMAVDVTQPHSATLKVVYDGRYEAAATVEIMPGGIVIDPDPEATQTSIILLESSVTVNTAKTDGALVPVVVTNRDISELMSVLENKEYSLMDSGSDLSADIELGTYDKNNGWKKEDKFSAGWHKNDSRYIEIKALDGAKSQKDIYVRVIPKENNPENLYIEAVGKLSLTVAEKYPKITINAGQLDLFYPGNEAVITAVSDDGECFDLNLEFSDKDADRFAYDQANNSVKFGGVIPKTGSYKAVVTLKITGYKKAYKTNPSVNIKVVNNVPKLKLSSSNITLTGAGPAYVSLLSKDSKRTLESWGDINGITLDDITAVYDEGTIIIPSGTDAGTHKVRVSFIGGSKDVILELKVKITDHSKTSISSKTKSLTVNVNHTGTIAVIDITPSAADVYLTDWTIKNLPGGIGFEASDNRVTLKAEGALSKTAKDITLEIDSSGNPFSKPIKVKLKITDKKTSFSVALKGKIDIANPLSDMTATAKLSNTASAIAESGVTLLGEGSDNFEVYSISGNTFRIRVMEGKLPVPGVTYSLTVRLALENGDSSMEEKVIKIKPVQTAGKVWQSTKSLKLYKLTPQSGDIIKLDLLKPANTILGAAVIDEASVKSAKLPEGSFELVPTGENSYMLKFAGGVIPVSAELDKNGVPKSLKTSYNIKLKLWADGTYKTVVDGKPEALGVTDSKGKFTAKSKCTTVTVKVNIG